MKLYSIVWWASLVFWLPDGSIAPYSKIEVKFNEGSCKFAVQSFMKKHKLPYSETPACKQETLSRYQNIVDADPRYLPDGQYDRVVYFCPARGKCRDVE